MVLNIYISTVIEATFIMLSVWIIYSVCVKKKLTDSITAYIQLIVIALVKKG